jgi:hypothetical protein
MSLLKEAILTNQTDLLYETLPVVQLIVEINSKLIGEFLQQGLVEIVVKLINNTQITIFRVHQLCFSLLGCLFLGTKEECEVKLEIKCSLFFNIM